MYNHRTLQDLFLNASICNKALVAYESKKHTLLF